MGDFINNISRSESTELKNKLGLDLDWWKTSLNAAYLNKLDDLDQKIEYQQDAILAKIVNVANKKLNKEWLRNYLIGEIDKMLK